MTIRVLLVEDDPTDAELLTDAVTAALTDAEVKCVDDEPSFRRALREGCDVVLADYTMPRFGALRVLELVADSDSAVPVIVVSGAIGEDLAIDAMRRGAADYLLKDRLVRLGQAIEQAIRRHELQGALARSERRLRAMIDSEPECVKVVARDGTLVDMNPAGAKMLEAECDEIIGQPLAPHLYPDDRFAFWKLHKAVLGGETGKLVFRVVGKRGTVRWMETHSAPLRDDDGEIEAVLSITRDITGSRVAEERAHEADAVLRALLANTQDVIWVMDAASGKLLQLSDSFEAVWGMPVADGKRGAWPPSVHADDRKEVARAVARQAGGDTQRRYRIVRADGAVTEIDERTVAVRDRADKVYRIVGVARIAAPREAS